MKLRSLFSPLILLLSLSSSHALFAPETIEAIPLERFTRNLRDRAEKEPKNASVQYALGRFHALAFAQGRDNFHVSKSMLELNEGRPVFDAILDHGSYSLPPQPYPFVLQKKLAPTPAYLATLSEEQRKELEQAEWSRNEVARAQLEIAIKHYSAAVELDPKNQIYRLGLAWAVDWSGERYTAIQLYWELLNDAFDAYKRTPEYAEDQKNRAAGVIQYGGSLRQAILKETASSLDRLIATGNAQMAPMADLCREVQRLVPHPPSMVTPILIPLGASADFQDLIDPDTSVVFDLSGLDRGSKWQWISPQAGWLVWDPSGEGAIRSGRQLFGSVSFWSFWPNGYEALSVLDDNGDGEISASELDGLSVWRDANSNGLSEPGEVKPVSDYGIVALSCTYELHPEGYWSAQGVTFEGGGKKPSYDWLVPSAGSDSAGPQLEPPPLQ